MANRAGDVKALIRLLLMEQDSIQALVKDRIYTQHPMLADNTNSSAEYPCIVIEALVGFGNYSPGLQRITYDIYAYSKVSAGEATEVYDAMYAVMHPCRLWDPDGNIGAAGYIREIERPDDIFNESLKVWAARGKWVANTAQP